MLLRLLVYPIIFLAVSRHKAIRKKPSYLSIILLSQYVVVSEMVHWWQPQTGYYFDWYAVSAIILGTLAIYFQVINFMNYAEIARDTLSKPQLFGSTIVKISLVLIFCFYIFVGLYLLNSGLGRYFILF